MSVEGWKRQILNEVIQFNPSESLKKGAIAKKIAMEQLVPFTRKITDYEMSEFKGGSKFRNWDTLIARITPCLENGKTAYVDILNDGEVAFGSTEFIVMRKKESITDDKFIYYLAISQEFRSKAIQSMIGSSGRQRVQYDALQSHEIFLPSLLEQHAIAATLSALDDAIELNNKINKNLEEMAQAIFKSWFVEFEPFKGGEFEESELGLIPKGWRFGTIGEVCTDIFSGGTPSTSNLDYWNGKYPWLSSGETRTSIIVETEKSITDEGIDNSSTRLAKKNDIVIASAGQGHTRGQTAITLIDTYINQSVIALRANPHSVGYLFCNLRNRYDELRAISDSSSIRGSLTTKAMKQFPILLPSQKVLSEFETTFRWIIELCGQSLYENRALTKIRDILLPKLMSGEIIVPVEEVEQLV